MPEKDPIDANLFLNDQVFRKAMAVYHIRSIIDRDYNGKRVTFARDIMDVSETSISFWLNPEKKDRAPTAKSIRTLAENTHYSVESMIQDTLSADDIHGFLKNSKIARDYRKRNYIGEERTQDSSDAHISNLRTFSANEYKLYYLETGNDKVSYFQIERIELPKKSGYLELNMSRNREEAPYLGTIIVPPGLDRAFIFLSQKNRDGNYLDRGMVILYYPQERARINHEYGYQCGVGVAMTLDRHGSHPVLLQRVILLQDGLNPDPRIKGFIHSYLTKPIQGENVLSVNDLPESQSKLYSYIKKAPQPTETEESLSDTFQEDKMEDAI